MTNTLTPCPDCGVEPGTRHEDGCDVSRCPECGEQALQCEEHSESGQSAWTGSWPGDVECREWDWWTSVTHPDGTTEMTADLNRLARAAAFGEVRWDKQTERYLKVVA